MLLLLCGGGETWCVEKHPRILPPFGPNPRPRPCDARAALPGADMCPIVWSPRPGGVRTPDDSSLYVLVWCYLLTCFRARHRCQAPSSTIPRPLPRRPPLALGLLRAFVQEGPLPRCPLSPRPAGVGLILGTFTRRTILPDLVAI